MISGENKLVQGQTMEEKRGQATLLTASTAVPAFTVWVSPTNQQQGCQAPFPRARRGSGLSDPFGLSSLFGMLDSAHKKDQTDRRTR
jgi:hypothetical protein